MIKTRLCLAVMFFACGNAQKIAPKTVQSDAKSKASSTSSLSVQFTRKAIDLENLGRFKDAEQYYLKAIDADPTYENAHVRYAAFLVEQGDALAAHQLATDYKSQNPKAKENLWSLVHIDLALNDPKQALSTLDELENLDDTDPLIFEKRARIFQTQRNPKAINEFKKAIKLENDNLEFKNQHALALIQFKKYRQATALLKSLLKTHGDYSPAWTTQAMLLRSQHKSSQARSSHLKALKLDDSLARNHFEYAVTLNLANENQLAETELGRAIDINPDVFSYWAAYGDVLRLMHQYKDASQAYIKALRLKADHPAILYKLAFCQIKMKDYDSAQQNTDTLLSIDPQNKRGLELRKTLHSIR